MDVNITLHREDYHWGTLRKIIVGHSIKVIIHPDNWNGISYVMSGDLPEYTFTDEQFIPWRIRPGKEDYTIEITCDNTNYGGCIILTVAELTEID